MPLATASRRRARVPGDAAAAPLERARAAWLPGSSSRRTRPVLAAAGVLVVLVCAAGGAALAGRQGQRQPFLALARAVPAGQPLTAGDLTTVALDPGTGLALVPASTEAVVLGKRAAVPLQAGTLLDPAVLATGAPVPAGDAVVGASLQPEQVPAELQPGDAVMVVLTGGSAAGAAAAGGGGLAAGGGSSGGGAAAGGGRPPAQVGDVLTDAVALAVVTPAAGGAGGGAANVATLVDLAVPMAAAAAVTSASAAGQVSLALLAPPSPAAAGRGR